MSKRKLRMPSPAMIVALVALFIGLGGASYAAVKIGKGSVKTKSIKNGAVTEKKLAPAVRGAAVAWAQVAANGSIISSRGISSANLVHSGGGIYCFNNLPEHGATTLTPSWTGDEFGSFAIATLSKPSSSDLNPACTNTQLAVITQFFNIAADTAPYTPEGFTIVLHK